MVGLAKLILAQTRQPWYWPNLVLAKLSLPKRGLPKLVLAKVGLAKVGHSPLPLRGPTQTAPKTARSGGLPIESQIGRVKFHKGRRGEEGLKGEDDETPGARLVKNKTLFPKGSNTMHTWKRKFRK